MNQGPLTTELQWCHGCSSFFKNNPSVICWHPNELPVCLFPLMRESWAGSDSDCYRLTNYPGQWGKASDSVITGSLVSQQPYAWIWPPVTPHFGTGDGRKAGLRHGGGSEGVLIHQDSVTSLVPDSRALSAVGRWSQGLIWPSWRKRVIRVQLVQTEVK